SRARLGENQSADVITASELGSGYAVAFTAAGAWLDYVVNVQLGGTSRIDFRLSSKQQSAGTFHLQIDGADVTGPITIPNTDDFSAWRPVTNTGVSLCSGPHV